MEPESENGPGGRESLRIRGISKRYPGVTALDGVDLVLRKGEIHGLVGKNGAGKSTVVKILYGVTNTDAGNIEINGADGPVEVRMADYNPIRAREMGVYMVPQEPVFALDLTIEENFFMANPLMKGFLTMDREEMRDRTVRCLRDFELDFSPNLKIRDVPMEDRHLLYTALVVDLYPSRIVLLDEVTSALRKNKCDILFAYLNRVKKDKAIALITHRVKEVIEFCDLVTVFRNGRRVVTDSVANMDEGKLANLIVGENVEIPKFAEASYIDLSADPKPMLSARGLSCAPFFSDISFALHEGEILGVTGLVESGAPQLLRCLAGVEELKGGSVSFKGKTLPAATPDFALRNGIVYGTNDRLNEGNFPELSVMDNINACVWSRLAVPPFGFLSRSREEESYREAVSSFNLKSHSPRSNILSLSGGNQQKAILTRLIATGASIFILDEPTKGIDVGTVYEILRYLRQKIISKNCGIIVNLSSIEEMLLVCDRVLTIVDGRMAGEFHRSEFSEDAIFRSIQGFV
ncbi:MAG: sugar ABC transporter ATP-binding protein [Planctomycetota bacterium]|jgi:ABC-type sugar transport system ATPase subunit|nr:sugar ABC transporter ATP-binding protein [Planctomycetota bacterium]